MKLPSVHQTIMRICVRSEAAAGEGSECIVICAQLEADLVGLARGTARVSGVARVKSSGVDQLIQSAYRTLGLMSFLRRARKKYAPGRSRRTLVLRSGSWSNSPDIERGFIRAEIVGYTDLIRDRMRWLRNEVSHAWKAKTTSCRKAIS